MSSPPRPVEELQRHADRLQALAESTRVFAEANVDIDRLLGIVAKRFAELIGDGCYIRLLGDDGESLLPVALYHADPEVERYLHATTDDVSLKVGEGISGKVVATGVPVLVPVMPIEQLRATTKPELASVFERVGMRSLIVVRLRARGVTHGFIALIRNGPDRPPYTQDDLQLMEDLADRAALAIDAARLVRDLEERVRARTAELEKAIHELEGFSYSVSHDLRAPLRAIDGFSQMLEEDHASALDADGRRVVSVIRKNTQRMGQLIDDLLRFSRLGRQAMEPMVPVPMAALVQSVIDEVRPQHPGRNIEVEVRDLPAATCNYDLIRQVWWNLLENAVKYTRGKPVAKIVVSGAIEEGEARFTVSDNGTGFDPKYKEKLFQVFQRLHTVAEFEGTGVGLALVHRIVSRHGGRVWVDSRLGEGSTFGFALPHRSAS